MRPLIPHLMLLPSYGQPVSSRMFRSWHPQNTAMVTGKNRFLDHVDHPNPTFDLRPSDEIRSA